MSPRERRRSSDPWPRTPEEKFEDWRERSPIGKLFHFPSEVPLWKIPRVLIGLFTPPKNPNGSRGDRSR